MKTISISADYWDLLDSAQESLDIKVKSPWPGQIKRRNELRHLMEPEHVLVQKVREGVTCRLICLNQKSYRKFFQRGGDQMADSPYFEEVQEMLCSLQEAGGQVRLIEDELNPDISFVVADNARAIMFAGGWLEQNSLAPGEDNFRQESYITEDQEIIKFLLKAFHIFWIAL